MNSVIKVAVAITLSFALLSQAPAQTNSDQSVEELRNTLVGVLEALVQKGLLTREQAQAIVADAQAKAQSTAKTKADQDADVKDSLRVTYVPQIVRDEISKQVSAELKPKVTKDVIAQAKTDKWGVPGALPEWISSIKLYGDIRFRAENDSFAADNATDAYYNYSAINSAGGVTKAGANAFLNTTTDRFRERLRLRIGLDANIADNVLAGIRLTSGSLTDPVSTNQTLGQNANRYQVGIDQAYLRYNAGSQPKLPWMTVSLGRIPNPWVSTDLVWDPDLQFEGVASTWRVGFGGSSATPRNVFLTAGAFPLQEVELTSRDKWLYGGQLGFAWPWSDSGKATIAGAYYYFRHISGERNAAGSTLLNYTAPQFMQKGNTVFDILNDTDATTNLYALAPDYHELDITAAVDIPAFNHLLSITADYVTNLGYDQRSLLAKSGFSSLSEVTDPVSRLAFDKMVKGYQVEFAFGSRNTGKQGTWRGALSYKHLERDAVVDAFTDSDFHLGGTGAKGYTVRGEWWFLDRNWLSLRYISSDEIRHTGPMYYDSSNTLIQPTDTPRFGVDVFLFDVNAQF